MGHPGVSGEWRKADSSPFGFAQGAEWKYKKTAEWKYKKTEEWKYRKTEERVRPHLSDDKTVAKMGHPVWNEAIARRR